MEINLLIKIVKRNKLGQFIKGFKYPKEWAAKRVRPKGLKYEIKVKNKEWFEEGNKPWNEGTKGICKTNSGSFCKGEHHSSKTEFKEKDKRIMGKNNPRWKGGITLLNVKLRNSYEIRMWRKKVFSRDNFICQVCHQKGGKLESHHIKAWSKFPQLRFVVDNGITLCEQCHKLTDNYKNI